MQTLIHEIIAALSFVVCRCFFVAIYINQPFVIGLYFKKALSETMFLQVVYRVRYKDKYDSCRKASQWQFHMLLTS